MLGMLQQIVWRVPGPMRSCVQAGYGRVQEKDFLLGVTVDCVL